MMCVCMFVIMHVYMYVEMYDQCQGFNSLSPRHNILIAPFNPKVVLKQSFKIYNPNEKEKKYDSHYAKQYTKENLEIELPYDQAIQLLNI